MQVKIWDREEKVKIIQLADVCHQHGIRVEGPKQPVRSKMPPVVVLSDFAIWCGWRHLLRSNAHTTPGIRT